MDQDSGGIVIITEIEGGSPDSVIERAIDAVDQGVAALPPWLRPKPRESFKIEVRHRQECPAKADREMGKCTCPTLGIKATLMTVGDADALRLSGKYDAEIDPSKPLN